MKRLSSRYKYSAITPESYIEGYPRDYEHVNIGVKRVNVSDIIGMTDGRNLEYDDNMLPLGEPDERWNRIYK